MAFSLPHKTGSSQLRAKMGMVRQTPGSLDFIVQGSLWLKTWLKIGMYIRAKPNVLFSTLIDSEAQVSEGWKHATNSHLRYFVGNGATGIIKTWWCLFADFSLQISVTFPIDPYSSNPHQTFHCAALSHSNLKRISIRHPTFFAHDIMHPIYCQSGSNQSLLSFPLKSIHCSKDFSQPARSLCWRGTGSLRRRRMVIKMHWIM